MTESLQKKVDRAIKLIRAAGKIANEHGQPLEIAYSGGKDSDVILELTKMSGVEYRAIYKNTTIDPAGTIKHAEEMGAEILRPKDTFFHLIAKHGIPNMFFRFCCGYLKEYKVLDYAVIGVRREESRKRAERYKEPEQCRVYSKKEKVRQYMPILDWTKDDVAEFIQERGIKVHSLYYDEDGVFHPERRLGCVGCPIGRKNRLSELKSHPNMVKAYVRAAQKFLDTHPDSKAAKSYKDAYAWMVRELFYEFRTDEWKQANSGMSFLPPPNYRELLEDFFKIKFHD